MNTTSRVYVSGDCTYTSGEKIVCTCGWESRVFSAYENTQLSELARAEREHMAYHYQNPQKESIS